MSRVLASASGHVLTLPGGGVLVGAAPTAFVNVIPLQGLLRPPSSIFVPNYAASGPTDINAGQIGGQNRTLDCRDKPITYHPPKGALRLRGAPAGTIVTGLRVTGLQSDNIVWRCMKTDKCGFDWDDNGLFSSDSVGPLTWEACALYGAMDAASPTGQSGHTIYRGVYSQTSRDEFLENDALNQVTIEDCLINSTHMFVSQRPGGSNPDPQPAQFPLTIRHTLARLSGQLYDTDAGNPPGLPDNGSKFTHPYGHPQRQLISPSGNGPGYVHGGLFKWSGVSGTVDIRHSIFLVEALPVSANLADFRPGIHENVVLVWLGGGPYPGLLPSSGVTVMTGEAGLNFWNFHRDDWLVKHGDPTKTGNDFTFLHAA